MSVCPADDAARARLAPRPELRRRGLSSAPDRPPLIGVSSLSIPPQAAIAAAEAEKAKKLAEKEAKEAAKGPKRGTTAYFFYTADVRAKFKEENPDAKLGDLAKLMGAKWKTLSAEDKEMASKTPATPSLASYHANITRKVLNFARFASTRRWPEGCFRAVCDQPSCHVDLADGPQKSKGVFKVPKRAQK